MMGGTYRAKMTIWFSSWRTHMDPFSRGRSAPNPARMAPPIWCCRYSITSPWVQTTTGSPLGLSDSMTPIESAGRPGPSPSLVSIDSPSSLDKGRTVR